VDESVQQEYEQMMQRNRPKLGEYASSADRNAAVIAAYQQGAQSTALAKQFGVSKQRIWQILKRHGVKAHYQMVPPPEELVRIIDADRIASVRELSAHMAITPSRLTSALRRHPDWPVYRAKMRVNRTERKRVVLRERVHAIYRDLTATLGRPATIQEMVANRIYTATLHRLYGERYISKFREDMGEVG